MKKPTAKQRPSPYAQWAWDTFIDRVYSKATRSLVPPAPDTVHDRLAFVHTIISERLHKFNADPLTWTLEFVRFGLAGLSRSREQDSESRARQQQQLADDNQDKILNPRGRGKILNEHGKEVASPHKDIDVYSREAVYTAGKLALADGVINQDELFLILARLTGATSERLARRRGVTRQAMDKRLKRIEKRLYDYAPKPKKPVVGYPYLREYTTEGPGRCNLCGAPIWWRPLNFLKTVKNVRSYYEHDTIFAAAAEDELHEVDTLLTKAYGCIEPDRVHGVVIPKAAPWVQKIELDNPAEKNYSRLQPHRDGKCHRCGEMDCEKGRPWKQQCKARKKWLKNPQDCDESAQWIKPKWQRPWFNPRDFAPQPSVIYNRLFPGSQEYKKHTEGEKGDYPVDWECEAAAKGAHAPQDLKLEVLQAALHTWMRANVISPQSPPRRKRSARKVRTQLAEKRRVAKERARMQQRVEMGRLARTIHVHPTHRATFEHYKGGLYAHLPPDDADFRARCKTCAEVYAPDFPETTFWDWVTALNQE
jgi:hypothetical protein